MAFAAAFAVTTILQVGIGMLFPAEGPRIKDLKVSGSTYGAPIPWAFGHVRVGGNLIWSKPIRERKKKKSGKGGSYNEYTYFCTFAMGLCKGPVSQIRKIWADSKLIYDITGESGAVNNSKYRIRFYNGAEDQMPDSLMIADRGEGNTPAFRGLAYIMFDDMPLADFGNRIPQFAVEVFVGVGTSSALANPITIDGTTPIEDDFVARESYADWDRGYIYNHYPDELRRVSISSGEQDRVVGTTAFGFPETNTSYDNQRLSRLLCVGRDGAPFVTHGGDWAMLPIDRLDPYSYRCAATFGTVEAGGAANTETGFVNTRAAAVAQASDGTEFLLALGEAGQVGVLRTSDLTYKLGRDLALTGALSGDDFYPIGRDAVNTGFPTFYVLWGRSGAFKLSRIGDGTQIDLYNLPATGVYGIVWDSGAPGVVMMWRDATGSFISKWSEDTGQEIWRTPINGAPVDLVGHTRILNSEFSWVYNGAVYLIDTSTGAFLDRSVDPVDGSIDDNPVVGMPDWPQYIANYPIINTTWVLFGHAVADNIISYAQYYWYHTGQADGQTLPMITVATGQGIPLPAPYTTYTPDAMIYDSTRGLIIGLGDVSLLIHTGSAGTGTTVGAAVERLLREGGLTSQDFDLTAIYAINMRGYGWASGTNIKELIEQLRRLYLFDLVERDGRIVAVMRGDGSDGNGQSVATIPQNILGSSSEDVSDFWRETRTQEAELPERVTLNFMNWDADFETSMSSTKRITNPYPTMFSRQQIALEMNVVMTPGEAKKQVNRILYSQWAERNKHETTLPWACLDLDPGDLITVNMNDGRSYFDRMHRTEMGADYSIQLEAYSQDNTAYIWDDLNADGGSHTPPTIQVPKPSTPLVLNTPLLRDADDTGGSFSRYYIGVGNGAPGAFMGATLMKSFNNTDYDSMFSETSDVEWGTSANALASPRQGYYALDWTSRLTIYPAVSWFELEPITNDELWRGLNLCVIGDEVIQFRDCEQNGDGSWTLWNLLRGRRGTQYACDSHTIGEKFIFLNAETINLAGDTLDSRGQARFFKSVSSGQSIIDAAPIQINYEPRDLMPYAVNEVQRSFEVNGDVTIDWKRRTRIGGNLQDGTGEVPLGEATERYEVYILSAPFSGDLSRGFPPSVYRRLYTSVTPTVTYTAADQTADGYDADLDTLHVVIYQLSASVGRGFPSARSIEPFRTNFEY